MKIKDDVPDDSEEEFDEEIDGQDLEDRKKDYAELKSIKEQLGDLYSTVQKGFDDKEDQARVISECWDIYNCVLNENQSYVGKTNAYVPLIHDAVNARETRLINMLFPTTDRFADVVGENGEIPHEIIALLDYYVRTTSLRENVVPALLRGGDISGNISMYIEWDSTTRCVTSKKEVAETTTELGTKVDGSTTYDDVEYEEIKDEGPAVSVLDPRDLLILPTTIDDIEKAEIVTVCLRFSKSKVQKYIDDGVFNKAAGKTLIQNMSAKPLPRQSDTAKKANAAAGVQSDGKGNAQALIYQIWTKLKLRKGESRLMVTHMCGEDLVLSCKRNPYWNDRIPVIHQPIEKVGGTIWGRSQVKPISHLQYAANDALNMGFDSAQYALLPIVMTDPEKNPRVGSMILAMAAIWETNPNDTQFASFPPLWKDAFTLVSACKDQIMQSLGVNPAMMPNGAAAKKPTQAQVAQEQQVALASVSDVLGMIIKPLNMLLEWFYDLDYQYRTEAITVKKFGQLGLQADMDQVEPQQVRQRLTFRWYGVEGTKSAQQVQQMISWSNVLRGMPPQVLNGRKLDLGPVLEFISEVTFGPRIAPKVLIDQRHQLTMPIESENELLELGFPVQVQPMDDDQAHIEGHMLRFKDTIARHEDVTGNIRLHIMEHMKAAAAKAAMAQGQPAPGSVPPGMPGQPRPGAQSQMPTGPQQAPGAISTDSMQDPGKMPRGPQM